MRRTLIAASATLALLSGAALAQTSSPTVTTPSSPSASPSTMSNTAKPDTAGPGVSGGLTGGQMASADALLGKNVYGRDNEKIGEVDDVILDPQGQAKQLVIGSGGFLGIGEKKVAVEYNAASWDAANNRINMSGLSRDDVKAMPEFKYDDTMTSLNRTRKPADTTAPSTTPSTTVK